MARVGAENAMLTTGKDSLVYGVKTQGVIDRIGLNLGGETFAQWSQRIFGSLVSQTYAVERSTSLAPNEWSIQQADIQGDGTQKTLTDTKPGAAPRLFCRVSVSPPE